MTWQQLFDELSTSQSGAFLAGDIVKVRHTIAGIETFIRNYQDVGCPDHAASVPEPIVSHIRKEMALRFPWSGPIRTLARRRGCPLLRFVTMRPSRPLGCPCASLRIFSGVLGFA